MTSHEYEKLMAGAGVRPSPVRLLVLKTISEARRPVSSQEIEQRLETVDRSSINRSLSLLADKGLLHAVDDGSGAVKYEVCCSAGCHDRHDDRHPHFRCTACGRTFCFDNMGVPPICLPEGFEAHSVNYVVQGLCAVCAGKPGR
ncbi:MAG: transcriptional repressor [Muribaculaceae bacterium]|nr:transcriptional repressor [Muribaculaceae bacterium]